MSDVTSLCEFRGESVINCKDGWTSWEGRDAGHRSCREGSLTSSLSHLKAGCPMYVVQASAFMWGNACSVLHALLPGSAEVPQ